MVVRDNNGLVCGWVDRNGSIGKSLDLLTLFCSLDLGLVSRFS